MLVSQTFREDAMLRGDAGEPIHTFQVGSFRPGAMAQMSYARLPNWTERR